MIYAAATPLRDACCLRHADTRASAAARVIHVVFAFSYHHIFA